MINTDPISSLHGGAWWVSMLNAVAIPIDNKVLDVEEQIPKAKEIRPFLEVRTTGERGEIIYAEGEMIYLWINEKICPYHVDELRPVIQP